MKYMTPDLLADTRSENDDVVERAVVAWRSRCAAYRDHLKEIKPRLPSGVRNLLRRYSLHDAKVLAMAADDVPHFSLFLELETPPSPADKYLELRYRLVGGPRRGLDVCKHENLAGDGTALKLWLYDEFDVTQGAVEAFTHCFLLSGGYEFQLTFYALSCRRVSYLYPPTNGEREVDSKDFDSGNMLNWLVGGTASTAASGAVQ